MDRGPFMISIPMFSFLLVGVICTYLRQVYILHKALYELYNFYWWRLAQVANESYLLLSK